MERNKKLIMVALCVLVAITVLGTIVFKQGIYSKADDISEEQQDELNEKTINLSDYTTDVSFSDEKVIEIIAEEYGLIGSLLIIILFGLLFYFGFSISKKQNEYKLSLLSIGIVSLIGVQVVINLGVVVGLLPVTGITLPFISYGGSSLIILDIGIGLLLNLAREEKSWIF